MAVVWSNNGIDYKAKLFLQLVAEAVLTVRLYTNNYTPLVTSVNADFTECALAGYAAVALVPANWVGATIAGIAQYGYPTITFTFNAYAGGTTIRGYYVTIPGVTEILALKFDDPYLVPAGGGTLTLDITDVMQSF